MFESDKYIGIKHITNGDSFDGCDCLGLIRLFYREHGWSEDFWDNGEPVTVETIHDKDNWTRLFRYLNKNMKRVINPENLEYGDVVVFDVDGDLHLGIYIQDGLVLAMSVPVAEGKTKSVLYHRRMWSHAYKRGYRRCSNCQ